MGGKVQSNENKEYQDFRIKTSMILDVSVLCFVMIIFSIFGFGIPFGIVIASVMATLKHRLEGGKERTFQIFMNYSMKNLGKATLIWIMLFPILIIICISLFIASQMGDIGLYIVIIDLLAIIAFLTYCFYVFYEFVCNPELKKISILKTAYSKMKSNTSNTFLHIGIMIGIVGVALFIPYIFVKYCLIYILIAVLMIVSSISMRDVK
jgi:hypothetical protein